MSKKKWLNCRKFISSALIGVGGALQSKAFISVPNNSFSDQNAAGRITGKVLGGSELAMPHSKVQLTDRTTKIVNTITTDNEEKLEFGDFKADIYEVSVSLMMGFAPVEVDWPIGWLNSQLHEVDEDFIKNSQIRFLQQV